MKVGVFTVLFAAKKFTDALKYIQRAGLDTIELGTGAYPGAPHTNVAELLKNQAKIREYKQKVADHGLEISALSCHGNPLHPNRAQRDKDHKEHRNTVLLAEKMGIKTVINFSGCPGGSEKDTTPNWVTCAWPPDFPQLLEWQWEKKVIPYWSREAKFAADHGIRIAFEMHPGFVVYNTETMLRLRKECGKNIGANFDPSHLFWQGMDPLVSLRALKGAVFHVHGKDCIIHEDNTKLNGALDTKSYADEANRSWIFRTIGYGHGEDFWRDFVSTLRLIGYNGTISIEHEDSLLSVNEGFLKAVGLLKSVVLREKPGAIWWA